MLDWRNFTAARGDWTREEIREVYHSPMMDLIFAAGNLHRALHPANEVQVCTLLSVKTGGCPEDCAYCPQAARYQTDLEVHRLMDVEKVLEAAREAKDAGSTRFCMGAAWREVRDNRDFERIVAMIEGVNELGLEVCCTLGMITEEQAVRMKAAGLHAYNHNLDSAPEFYDKIITTRTYEDRLRTLANVRKAGITVCCGGIVGMGENDDERIGLLHTLSNLRPHPESTPINALVAVEGTPLGDRPKVQIWDMVRMIATARLILPYTQVRLSAGRVHMSEEQQALCFLAGANSIFAGEKLLTTPNNERDSDAELFALLGLVPRVPNKELQTA
jgi:biotin synthase